jgi:hypothetical protein
LRYVIPFTHFYLHGHAHGWSLRHISDKITKWRFHSTSNDVHLELVSKELNHFGVIADLFQQIGGHSCRFVLFCSFWRLFTVKMIESVKVFPFSFWKIITIFFFTSWISNPRHKHAKWPPSDLTPWTLTLCPLQELKNYFCLGCR